MESATPSISVLEPVSPAIEKTKSILFQPFDLKKWGVFGFCAWLAMLGERGGGGGGGRFQMPRGGSAGAEAAQARAWLAANLYWLAPTVLLLVLFIVAICLVLLWLRSRGKFMFLHCVATNRAEVAVPWQTFAAQANSLFLFKLALGAVSMLCILPLIGLLAFSIWLVAGAEIVIGGVILIALAVLLMIFACVVFGVITKFTHDFVVPIMALRRCRTMVAWREFAEILKADKGRFVLYLLFQLLIALVIGSITSILTIMTCCFCFTLCIPFVGTYIAAVIFLPLSTFARAYSLLYLAQYGPAYDVFGAAAPVLAQEAGGFVEGNGI